MTIKAFSRTLQFTQAVARFIKKGLALTTQDEFDARVAKCETCSSKSAGMTCRECGCFIPLKAKMKSETCPKNEWDELDD